MKERGISAVLAVPVLAAMLTGTALTVGPGAASNHPAPASTSTTITVPTTTTSTTTTTTIYDNINDDINDNDYDNDYDNSAAHYDNGACRTNPRLFNRTGETQPAK